MNAVELAAAVEAAVAMIELGNNGYAYLYGVAPEAIDGLRAAGYPVKYNARHGYVGYRKGFDFVGHMEDWGKPVRPVARPEPGPDYEALILNRQEKYLF